jgi:hypothetical protein
MTPVDLPSRWRSEAIVLRRRGAALQADVLEGCAAELEAYEHERELQTLTLHKAAQATGFSYSALQSMVANGTIPNGGRKGAPRVRRGDLPRKPPKKGSSTRGDPDLADRVLASMQMMSHMISAERAHEELLVTVTV